MPTPADAPPWAASRSWTPLALTVGLHLLLVLAWLIGARAGLVREPPQRASTLVLVQPVARPTPAPSVPPQPRLRSPDPAAFVAPVTVLPAQAATPASDPEPAGEPQSDTAPAPALPGDVLAHSKALAGRADRDLRKEGSPITAEPERKWERFADAFAAAKTSRSYSLTLERYEAPDGIIFYRKTIAGRKSCYRGGSVGGLQTGFGVADGRGAGSTPCPSGVSWTQH